MIMNNFALIESGTVVNVIVWDGSADLPADAFLANQHLVAIPEGVNVAVGAAYRDGEFEQPVPPAREESPITVVTMRQARLALLTAGKLSAVTAAIAALPSPHKEAAQIEWEYAATVDRSSDFVQTMAAALQLDEKALNELFEQAAML